MPVVGHYLPKLHNTASLFTHFRACQESSRITCEYVFYILSRSRALLVLRYLLRMLSFISLLFKYNTVNSILSVTGQNVRFSFK